MQKILHTPEGVRDIYSKECEQKLVLQEKLHAMIRSYGYQDIETPTFEYFDVFSKETVRRHPESYTSFLTAMAIRLYSDRILRRRSRVRHRSIFGTALLRCD